MDSSAPLEEPIQAAYNGTVIYVGSKFKDYENMIIIGHPNYLSSIQADNQKHLVEQNL
jgi:murein DD-endopeptidase MepM/ murein hydrolase activator NlpD